MRLYDLGAFVLIVGICAAIALITASQVTN
jgi:hypothetical protein